MGVLGWGGISTHVTHVILATMIECTRVGIGGTHHALVHHQGGIQRCRLDRSTLNVRVRKAEMDHHLPGRILPTPDIAVVRQVSVADMVVAGETSIARIDRAVTRGFEREAHATDRLIQHDSMLVIELVLLPTSAQYTAIAQMSETHHGALIYSKVERCRKIDHLRLNRRHRMSGHHHPSRIRRLSEPMASSEETMMLRGEVQRFLIISEMFDERLTDQIPMLADQTRRERHGPRRHHQLSRRSAFALLRHSLASLRYRGRTQI